MVSFWDLFVQPGWCYCSCCQLQTGTQRWYLDPATRISGNPAVAGTRFFGVSPLVPTHTSHAPRNMLFSFKRGPRIDLEWLFLCQIHVSWMFDRQTLPRATVFSCVFHSRSCEPRWQTFSFGSCNLQKIETMCEQNKSPQLIQVLMKAKGFTTLILEVDFYWSMAIYVLQILVTAPSRAYENMGVVLFMEEILHQWPWSAFHFCW